MTKQVKVLLISGVILTAVVTAIFLSGDPVETTAPEKEREATSISTQETEPEPSDGEFGTTIIVPGGKTIEDWQPLVEEKLIAEFELDKDSQFDFDYETIDESPMGSLSYQVTVGDQIYNVEVPGPSGFMFDTKGSAIEDESAMTAEDWQYNISVSKAE